MSAVYCSHIAVRSQAISRNIRKKYLSILIPSHIMVGCVPCYPVNRKMPLL